MNRYRHYYGQYPTDDEMNSLQSRAEQAIGDTVRVIQGKDGITDVDKIPVEDALMDVTVPALDCYVEGTQDADGGSGNVDVTRRVGWDSPQTVDCSTDKDSNPTVPSAGNLRYISIMAKYDETLSDARTDLDGVSLDYKHFESFAIEVWAGAEHAATPVKPTVGAGYVLLFDVLLDENSTTIIDPVDPENPIVDEIDYTRVTWLATQEVTNARGTERTLKDRVDFINDRQRRNVLINSNFDIWQRNTSISLIGAGPASLYCADRWWLTTGGGDATVSRQAFTIGQTDVPNEPEFYLRIVISGSASDMIIQQKKENVRTFAGKTISGSFWAKASFSGVTIGGAMLQYFGSGGSGTTQTGFSTGGTTATVWTKYAFNVDVPSISGETISGGDDYLSLRLRLDIPLGETFEIAQFQLNEGELLDYQPRTFREELSDCQRYYEKSYDQALFATDTGTNGALGGAAHGATGIWVIQGRYAVTKRLAPPTLAIYAPGSGTLARVRNITDGSDIVLLARSEGESGFAIGGADAGSTDDQLLCHFVADAEL